MLKALARFPSLDASIRETVEAERRRNGGRPVSHRLRRFIGDLHLSKRLEILGRIARERDWTGSPKDFVLALGLPSTKGQRKKIGRILAAWSDFGVLENVQSRRRPRYRLLEKFDSGRYLAWVEENRARADRNGVLADLDYPLDGRPWPFTVERLPSLGKEGHAQINDEWPVRARAMTPCSYVINGSPFRTLIDRGFAFPEEVQAVEEAVRIVHRTLKLWDSRVRHRKLTILGQSKGYFLDQRPAPEPAGGPPPSQAVLRAEYESLPRVGSVFVSHRNWPELTVLPLLRDFSFPLDLADLSLAPLFEVDATALHWLNEPHAWDAASPAARDGGAAR